MPPDTNLVGGQARDGLFVGVGLEDHFERPKEGWKKDTRVNTGNKDLPIFLQLCIGGSKEKHFYPLETFKVKLLDPN